MTHKKGPPLFELPSDCLVRILASCSTRDVLALASTCKECHRQLQGDELWMQLAEAKWGHHAAKLAQVERGGWAAWTKHRLVVGRQPISPLDLVQESFQECAFQHIAACLLCSRTTGGNTVREAIHLFLRLWPTPSAVMDAADASMLEVLRPLGLQATRLAGVRGLASDFLATDWSDPSDFKHCGCFVRDSWRIFCRGQRSPQGVEDRNLLRYLRWLVHGRAAPGGKRSDKAASRRAQQPLAQPGRLRSRRCKLGGAGATGKAGERAPADGRRVTRSAIAALRACPKPGLGSKL